MVREYERSASATYPDDLKIAAFVTALPPSLRVHIQMSLRDDTTFEELRQKIELYEQVSQRWSAEQGGLQLMVKPWGADEQDKTAGPMDVHAITYKGGKKGGKKGGGKKGEKGKSRKGKGFWSSEIANLTT